MSMSSSKLFFGLIPPRIRPKSLVCSSQVTPDWSGRDLDQFCISIHILFDAFLLSDFRPILPKIGPLLEPLGVTCSSVQSSPKIGPPLNQTFSGLVSGSSVRSCLRSDRLQSPFLRMTETVPISGNPTGWLSQMVKSLTPRFPKNRTCDVVAVKFRSSKVKLQSRSFMHVIAQIYKIYRIAFRKLIASSVLAWSCLFICSPTFSSQVEPHGFQNA